MKAFPRRAGPPVAEPLTLAEVLGHLREDASVSDADVLDLITVARETCEDRTERTMLSTPWRLTMDSFPDAFELVQPPIIAVQSVQFVDEAGVLQTLDPADYTLDNVSEPGYLVPAYGKEWPATRNQPNAVVVNYTAGYGTLPSSVPSPLRRWMKLAIADLYQNRGASSEKPKVKHNFVDGLLDPYRMVGI
ncbi:MAG: hypothetical protein DCF26_09410 [Burkholderiales bacterium]|nr:MAG: hypothetical protein DCF26_09410 [Burkholderiales bacterium]